MPAVPGHQGEPTDAANAPTVTTITVGTLRSASQRFSTPDTSGRYSVRLEFEHPDQVDGTDAIAIDWQPDGESPYTTHHTPDQLLRWLIQQAPGLSARFGGQLAEAEAEAFSTHLLLKEAKALLDDRTYERITVSGQEIEIRLKYLGLTVSLAALEDEAGSVLALLSGILGPDRHLEQVIVKVPLALLMRSTARHDSEEDAWVAVTPSE